MEVVKRRIVVAVALLTLTTVDCRQTQADLDYIYFNGNSSKTVVFRNFNRRNIKFFMYNRSRPNGYRLQQDVQNFRNSGFDNANPTKFLIHGYMGNYRSNSIQMPKNAYMAAGNYNIVAVDWSAYNFPYAVAVNSVRDVGYTVGDMMGFMSRHGGMDPSNTHVVGHSLGAHIAGYTGKSVRSRSKPRRKGKGTRNKGRVGRITGLDPAAPAFAGNPPSQRLDSEDAEFVDVIHTSVRLLGMAKSIGHADYYPAGGSRQPRCPDNMLEQATGLCDHGQSYVYFSQSIRNRHLFPAVGCSNAREAISRRCSGETGAYMGEAASGPNGVYYVSVNHVKKEKSPRIGNVTYTE